MISVLLLIRRFIEYHRQWENEAEPFERFGQSVLNVPKICRCILRLTRVDTHFAKLNHGVI